MALSIPHIYMVSLTSKSPWKITWHFYHSHFQTGSLSLTKHLCHSLNRHIYQAGSRLCLRIQRETYHNLFRDVNQKMTVIREWGKEMSEEKMCYQLTNPVINPEDWDWGLGFQPNRLFLVGINSWNLRDYSKMSVPLCNSRLLDISCITLGNSLSLLVF